MEMHPLRVFLTVATEKSFSRAAEKLLRTQPAISLSIQRLETELGERLIDRSAKDLLLTDAGKIVLEYAPRFGNLQRELANTLAVVLREFQRHKVPLRMDLEMPTTEAIRKMVQRDEGVAFLPRMCVDEEIRLGVLREVKVKEMDVERKIRLVYPGRRVLSRAARAF